MAWGDGGSGAVTLSDTLDTFEVVIADAGFVDDDAVDVLIADVVRGGDAADDDRTEPALASTPFFVEFDEPARLDPGRAGLIWELVPVGGRELRWRSPLVSLLFHLLPIVGIILFPLLAIEPPVPIPVQLVFEPPPPPPPPQPPQPAPKPPQLEQPLHGPLSSVDQGPVIKPTDLGRTPDPVPQPAAGPQQETPSEMQTATTAAPPPPPMPQAKPAPPKEHAFQLPKPSGAANAPHTETPREAPRSARYIGMAATKDEYLAYLVSLTRQHIDLLPLAMVGARRGETVISVTVYDNGRIGSVSVARGSGYSDIDERIAQMVRAVGKFPPLPQWYQGNGVQLELTLKFPEALEH